MRFAFFCRDFCSSSMALLVCLSPEALVCLGSLWVVVFVLVFMYGRVELPTCSVRVEPFSKCISMDPDMGLRPLMGRRMWDGRAKRSRVVLRRLMRCVGSCGKRLKLSMAVLRVLANVSSARVHSLFTVFFQNLLGVRLERGRECTWICAQMGSMLFMRSSWVMGMFDMCLNMGVLLSMSIKVKLLMLPSDVRCGDGGCCWCVFVLSGG